MTDFLNKLLSLTDPAGSASMEVSLLCLVGAFVFGQVVAWVYVWTHKGPSYSVSMARSLIVLSLVVALVMLVIGNSLARAFGLFGALALIRFRTPVKDARDTVFLFFSVAVGIAAGTQNLLGAAAGTTVICAALCYLHLANFGSRRENGGLVRFRCPSGGAAEQQARDLLKRACAGVSLLHMRDAGAELMEYAYEVRLRDQDHSPVLAAALHDIDGVQDLSLLMQDEYVEP